MYHRTTLLTGRQCCFLGRSGRRGSGVRDERLRCCVQTAHVHDINKQRNKIGGSSNLDDSWQQGGRAPSGQNYRNRLGMCGLCARPPGGAVLVCLVEYTPETESWPPPERQLQVFFLVRLGRSHRWHESGQ